MLFGKNLALGIGVGFEKTIPSIADEMIKTMDDLTSTISNNISIGEIPSVSRKITHENNYITIQYFVNYNHTRNCCNHICALYGDG